MNKILRKIVWWITTIILIVLGLMIYLLMKVIEWADPEEEWEKDWDKEPTNPESSPIDPS